MKIMQNNSPALMKLIYSVCRLLSIPIFILLLVAFLGTLFFINGFIEYNEIHHVIKTSEKYSRKCPSWMSKSDTKSATSKSKN